MEIQSNYLSIDQMAEQLRIQSGTTKPVVTDQGQSFKEVFADKLGRNDQLKFSKHAESRLKDRNISLSDEQLSRLQTGTSKAEEKGIRDSLVIVDQLAFIVNVPNRTVVTAMDSTETNENVYTNINGAVII